MKKILLLEDDQMLREGIVMALNREDYRFLPCRTIAEARTTIENQNPDLLILDINLPDGSGFDLCRQIRKQSKIPMILLTARDMELDIVSGLESGADDYITKPFSLMVLRARINALLRRAQPEEQQGQYAAGPFYFNFTIMEFLKQGEPIELSKTEQRLLHLLTANPGATLSRQMMLEKIWPDGSEYVEDNALSVTIKRLRAKLEEDPSRPQYIKTVYGLGYTWVHPS